MSRGGQRDQTGVAVIDRDEVGVDRRQEGRVVELDREIHRIVLGGPLPSGTYLGPM